MNSEFLRAMGPDELDAYAQALGFSAKAGKTAAAKVKIIEERRARTASVTVIGVQLEIPIKRAHDARVDELLGREGRTREDVVAAFDLLLGPEQHAELTRAATDEDGTVDDAALSLAYNALLASKELKNF